MKQFLTAQDLCYSYGKNSVLRNVSFSMPHGSLTSILGDSGSGKSTLLNVLAGVLGADSGTLTVAGDLWQDGTKFFLPMRRRSIAFIFQQSSLFPHKNVKDNILIAFPRRNEIRNHHAHFDKVVSMTGLGSFLNRMPLQLSGGQQQRVAIARALYSTPRLLLMDEPFSALDANLADSLRSDLQSWLQEFSITAVLVTHNQSEAFQVSDQVGILVEGRLLQIASPEDIYFQPAGQQVADRIGEGVCIILERHEGRFWHPDFGSLILPIDELPMQKLNVVVRPQDIELVPSNSSSRKSECQAQILERSFRGSNTVYKVRSPRGNQYLCNAGASFKVGDHVEMKYCSLRPSYFFT